MRSHETRQREIQIFFWAEVRLPADMLDHLALNMV